MIGFGTVGRGFAEVLLCQQERITKRSGISLHLDKIFARSLEKLPDKYSDSILVNNADAIIKDPDIDIVVELIGGIEPARTMVLAAIANGKHVVTANKSLLAEKGREIFAAAAEHEVDVGFEASVGGGIPVIKTLKEGLATNRILSIMGIMNGTANYILTRMTSEGASFSDVLHDAQELGFAEADPTYDIEGIDTAHKLAILMTMAYGMDVTLSDIVTEGISKIEPIDIQFAREFGYRIKLLAISRNHGGHVEARVHPTMIGENHLLSRIDGAFNAIHFTGDMTGDILLYGQGAGSLATGNAVAADVLDIARNIHAGSMGRVPALSYLPKYISRREITPLDKLACPYYFRISTNDEPGVLANIAGVLAKHEISIESVIQKGRMQRGQVTIVMRTHTACEVAVIKALAEIDGLAVVVTPTVKIRIFTEG